MIRPTIAITSLLTRAQATLEAVQQKAGLTNIPVIRFLPQIIPGGDLDNHPDNELTSPSTKRALIFVAEKLLIEIPQRLEAE